MPNHVHFIIEIVEGSGPQFFDTNPIVGAHHDAPAPRSDLRAIHESPLHQKRSILSQCIGYFKAISSKLIHQRFGNNFDVWQRGYYEHIIRNEKELRLIQEYTVYNPNGWASDNENPNKTMKKEADPA